MSPMQSAEPRSRGWVVLRSQWHQFVDRNRDLPSKPVVGIELPPRVSGSHQHLTKDEADRALYSIVSRYTKDTPRSIRGVKVWTRAKEVRDELRTTLEDISGSPFDGRRSHEDDLEKAKKDHEAPPMDPALAFLPPGWSRQLTEELLAELITDCAVSSYADAILDSAVLLTDAMRTAKNQSQASRSASEPALDRKPAISRDPGRLAEVRRVGEQKVKSTSQSGFPMAGLPRDSLEAWNTVRFHSCKSLEPYRDRIANAVQQHRPARHIDTKPEELPADHRKFNWPMMATNFPQTWNAASSNGADGLRQPEGGPSRRSKAGGAGAKNFPPPMRVDRQGRTCFPYSLVSHRAFLDALPDANLREQARRIAPLRTTTGS